MPQISNFLRTAFGIMLYMYGLDTKQHHLPHVHARYAGEEGVYDLAVNLIDGWLPHKQHKRVVQWIEDNPEALADRWTHAVNGNLIAPID